MTLKRFLRILVTAIAIFAAFSLWRTASTPETPDRPAAQQRGGQLIGSIRSEPRSYNRLTSREQNTEIISLLTQGRLVRINRSTFELEPWLAERADSSLDGLTHTLHLRQGVTWSDGQPFTAADVLFTFKALYDPKTESIAASALTIDGKPIAVTSPDPNTVVLTFPGPSGPGLRLLDNLTILPKHKLEAALASGALRTAWDSTASPSEIVGTGPFVVREYQPGQRMVLDRNPRYWRKAANGDQLPYLDRIVLEIVPDQNAELLRLQSGGIDLTQSELRAEDYVAARRSEAEGKLAIVELGVGTDADAFWFCMDPEVKRRDPRFAFVQKPEFRRAISHAVDRERFADSVFLSAAVPIWGPVTPGNRGWFTPNLPRYPHDEAKAREILASIGLSDRNGNGTIEDEKGTEARFTVVTQRGIGFYERGTAFLREALARVGITIEIAPLEFGTLVQKLQSCDYEAIYFRPLATDLDPAGNPDFWLSSGAAHLWNMSQKQPATPWEAEIDRLMREQSTTTDPRRRRELFTAAQKVFAENLPALYFAAPRLYYAHSKRVAGIVPSVLRPPALWNADQLSIISP